MSIYVGLGFNYRVQFPLGLEFLYRRTSSTIYLLIELRFWLGLPNLQEECSKAFYASEARSAIRLSASFVFHRVYIDR